MRIARLAPLGTLSVLAILIGTAAGCSSPGGAVRAAALEPGKPVSVPAAAGSSSPSAADGLPGTGTTSAVPPAPGSASRGAAKTPKTAATRGAAPAQTGAESGTVPAGPPPAPPGGGTAPVTGTAPPVSLPSTPPQEQASGSPSPTVSLTPAAQVTCTVSGDKPEIAAVITQGEASAGGEYFDVAEYGTAGVTVNIVALFVPGPLTAGEAVSAEGPQGPPMATCRVTAVSGA